MVALHSTSCEIGPGARLALVGPSGSGKSTLLHVIAGLQRPTVGSADWPGIGDVSALRPGPVGIVFQAPSLLAPLDVLENTAMPLLLAGVPAEQASVAAQRSLDAVRIGDLAGKLPSELSGGQAQRVAVARALVGEPVLILADEPTGQLDHRMAGIVVDALTAAARRTGAALVVATHDPVVAGALDEQWEMHDGTLIAPHATVEGGLGGRP